MSVVSLARKAGFTALPLNAPASVSRSRLEAETSMMSSSSWRMIWVMTSRNSARVRCRTNLPSASRTGPVPGIGFDMSPSLASAMMKSPLA